jgi:RNA-binding protein
MDFLGKVNEITPDGRLIVKCSDLPEINEIVYDKNQTKIGTVKRVFGPVDGPYASIEVNAAVPEVKRNTDLYTKGGISNGKGKGRSRRNRGLSRMWKPPLGPRL